MNGLCSDSKHVESFDRPVKSVAVDPEFYKSGSGKQFVTGDEQVINGFFTLEQFYLYFMLFQVNILPNSKMVEKYFLFKYN